MTGEELDTFNQMARALSATRAEINGTRVVLIAALSAISSDKVLCKSFVESLRAAREAEVAYCLSTPMSDAEMDERLGWVDRLTPLAMREGMLGDDSVPRA